MKPTTLPNPSLTTSKSNAVSYQQHYRSFANAFDGLTHRQSSHVVFDDFLEFTLLRMKFQKDPADYADLETRWKTTEEYRAFAEMFCCFSDMTIGEDGEGYHDPLGDFFMERLSNDRNGQFFTPMDLCRVMAQMQGISAADTGKTCNDCSCGSGRNLLAAAKLCPDMIFYGEDIDLRCCKMTLINMIANRMQGKVRHVDTLSMKVWKTWEVILITTPAGKLPYYYEVSNT